MKKNITEKSELIKILKIIYDNNINVTSKVKF